MSVIVADADTGTAESIRDVIGATLRDVYPGYMWAVRVLEMQGIAQIVCATASLQHGYVLHTKNMYSASEIRNLAIKAGGEILERYGLRRGQVNEAEWMSKQTDLRGNLIGDLH